MNEYYHIITKIYIQKKLSICIICSRNYVTAVIAHQDKYYHAINPKKEDGKTNDGLKVQKFRS